ncbi:MAG: TetR/AcrR family transcriptional regulator [Phycisphaeraceae bacterium]|nr:TetR/AcrR family transcriptional regulator [Phycisphaeraceae bacterium]MCW5763731.1 TetR/AcrR family transcriptional regulator [Phycisphaeraceae bacterium]
MSRLPAAKRREQLLDCAAELFAAQGYARATTAQLAKSAGVTEPIIYRHFKSKRDLFVALIERTGKRTLTRWEQDLEGADDPGERLRRLIGDNPMVAEGGREAYRVFLQAISEVDDDMIQAAIARHIASVHTFLEKEIVRAQEAHRVTNKYTAEVLAWLMINIGMGYGVLSAMKIRNHGIDASGTHVQEVLSRVLVGRPPEK